MGRDKIVCAYERLSNRGGTPNIRWAENAINQPTEGRAFGQNDSGQFSQPDLSKPD